MGQTTIRRPSVTVVNTNSILPVSNEEQRTLLVAQQRGGTNPSGNLVENIGNTGAPENALFGADSHASEVVRQFKAFNLQSRLDVIGLDDDGSAVSREITFTLLGTATGAGSVSVVFGSSILYTKTVAVAVGDTATQVADAIEALVTADTQIQWTFGHTAGAATIIAKNGGTVANENGIEVTVDAAGLSISVPLAESVIGATDPDLTGVLAPATERYQTIIWPYSDVTEVLAYLQARQNPQNEIKDGVAFIPSFGTVSEGLADGNALDDQEITYFYNKAESEVTGDTQYIGPSILEANYAALAQFCAIRSLRFTEGASISRFVVSTDALDQRGGPALASLPYANTPVDNLPAIKQGRGITAEEISDLEDAGVSVMGNNIAGNGIVVGQVVTTYKTDGANPDDTFKFLNYVDTASNVREYQSNNVRKRFAQSRLSDGRPVPQRAVATPGIIRGYLEKLYLDLTGKDFVLTRDGDAATFYKDELAIDLDLLTGEVTIDEKIPPVTQARSFFITNRIVFNLG